MLSMMGLDSLKVIPGNVLLFQNTNLISLLGLGNLTSVGGNFSIMYSYDLYDLFALESLTTIGGSFTTAGDLRLSNLVGLEGLTSIGRGLFIVVDSSLTSLTGLEGLTFLGESINVDNNLNLISLTGLDNINPGSITSISISQNPSLSNCEVKSICDRLATSGCYFTIQYNAAGCNSQAEVEAACESGTVEDLTSEDILSVFPNPSYGPFTLNVTLENPVRVRLEVLNRLGQVVAFILDEEISQGEH